MGACGGPTAVESAPANFGCSQMLMTDAEPAGEGNPHSSMGSDGVMAKDTNGYPINQRAMMYMFVAEH